jgi:hypothetical protein
VIGLFVVAGLTVPLSFLFLFLGLSTSSLWPIWLSIACSVAPAPLVILGMVGLSASRRKA